MHKQLVEICGETELGYAQTVELPLVGDEFQFPLLTWHSVGISVEAGAVDVSFDGGAIYTASYTSDSSSVLWGQGNTSIFDPSQIVVKSTAVDTRIQVIGDYVA